MQGRRWKLGHPERTDGIGSTPENFITNPLFIPCLDLEDDIIESCEGGAAEDSAGRGRKAQGPMGRRETWRWLEKRMPGAHEAQG